MIIDSEDVAFTIVASLRMSIDDIDCIAQDRWDAIFAESQYTKRRTRPRLVNSSPVSDDGLTRAFHFCGTLLA